MSLLLFIILKPQCFSEEEEATAGVPEDLVCIYVFIHANV